MIFDWTSGAYGLGRYAGELGELWNHAVGAPVASGTAMLYLGDVALDNAAFGDLAVDRIYAGDTLVWEP